MSVNVGFVPKDKTNNEIFKGNFLKPLKQLCMIYSFRKAACQIFRLRHFYIFQKMYFF